MPSTLDDSILAGVDNIHLSDLQSPLPTRMKPVGRDMTSDGWSHMEDDIWQTTPRMFGTFVNNKNKHGFLTRNNETALTDMSSHVARAPPNSSHNINTNLVNGSQSVPPSTILLSRSKGPLISPTKLRSYGIYGSETGMTMPTLGQSSLFTDSAPDIDLPTSSTSSSGLANRQGPTFGKESHAFSVEHCEEFIPSYLKDSHRQTNGSHSIQEEQTKDRFAGFVSGASRNGHGLMSKPTSQLNRSTIHSTRYNNTNQAGPIPDGVIGRNMYLGGLRVNEDVALGASLHQSNHTWERPNGSGTYNPNDTTQRPSNLRPDVASYQPATSNGNINSPIASRGYNGFNSSSRETSRTNSGEPYPYTGDYQTTSMNSRAYELNTAHATRHMRDVYDNTRSQKSTVSDRSRGSFNNENQGTLGVLNLDYNPRFDASTTTGLRATDSDSQVAPFPMPTPSLYPDTRYDFPMNSPNVGSYQLGFTAAPALPGVGYYPAFDSQQNCQPNNITRSEVLDEFRLHHKNRKYELKDIYGYIVEFSGDQTGSRFIQTRLEQASGDEKDQIFTELLTNARQLMQDVFGNYVIQKMFEYGNQSQKRALAEQMQGNVLKLSLSTYGCRCIQKAFEHVLTDQQASLVKELDGHVLSIVDSAHGNHVIQKAIETIPGEHIQFIVDAHKNQIVRSSKSVYGCRIVQRMLEYCMPHVKRAVLDELHSAIPSLIDDQYGNYVIQCMIQKCGPADRYRVVEYIKQRVLYYSMHKHASNVVEKAIQFGQENQRTEIIRQLTSPTAENGGRSPVLTLLRDQFGNYVMQTVLKSIQGPQKRVLADEFGRHLGTVGKVHRGRQFSAMAETVNSIIAGHSPSSTSSGPQTPRTPTSLASSGGTPMLKDLDLVSAGYPIRESQRNPMSLKSVHP